jgi:hypothetical protein
VPDGGGVPWLQERLRRPMTQGQRFIQSPMEMEDNRNPGNEMKLALVFIFV